MTTSNSSWDLSPSSSADVRSARSRVARALAAAKTEYALKRGLDVGLATVGLMLTVPLWLAVAAAIKLEDRGPIFYRQERWGRGKTRFAALKFRSMVLDGNPSSGTRQAGPGDPRITRVGRLMRKTALDELPQLVSIFFGDMSFVGPRALAVNEVQRNDPDASLPDDQVPGFAFRCSVRPGLTGVAQLYAPRDVARRSKFRYDAIYVRRQSLLLDLRLIARSLWISITGGWERYRSHLAEALLQQDASVAVVDDLSTGNWGLSRTSSADVRSARYRVARALAAAKTEYALKRGLDVGLATVGLILTVPLGLAVAAAIKLEDRGPIFYRQARWGRGKARFAALKFRSMVLDGDPAAGRRQADPGDPRITHIGRLMRKTALDELPQLVNILRGDMSFVGPRALPVNEIQRNDPDASLPDDQVPGFAFRCSVRPGLTGVAQLYASRDVARRSKFRYDAIYVRRQSFLLDLRLIARSLWISITGGWERYHLRVDRKLKGGVTER